MLYQYYEVGQKCISLTALPHTRTPRAVSATLIMGASALLLLSTVEHNGTDRGGFSAEALNTILSWCGWTRFAFTRQTRR